MDAMTRVLLVHQDPLQRHFLATFLQQSGFHVVQCANTEETIQLIQAQDSVEVIVFDLDLPEANVLEFSQFLRHDHDGRFANIPLICLSKVFSARDGERVTALLGGQAYIHLPVEPGVLRESVAQVLEGRSLVNPPRVLLVGSSFAWPIPAGEPFQRQGWSVRECLRASDLNKELNAYAPNIIVIHYPLQGLTGLEEVRAIKERVPSARIYVVTADECPQLGMNALQYGVDGFIREPIDPAYLVLLAAKAEWEQSGLRFSVSQSPSYETYPLTQKWKQFLHDFNEIVLFADEEGVIVEMNAYGSQILGWPTQDISGHTLIMLEPSAPLHWFGSTQDPMSPRETQFRTRNGSTVDVQVSVYPVKWDDGVRFILVAKCQQELTALRREVHALRKQVHKFEELESVGRLAGSVAHDVNNILTAIQGHASLLSYKGTADASTQKPAEVIRQAAHRGQELTAQLLGAARSGQERRASINIHDTIEEVLTLLSGNRSHEIDVIRKFEAKDSWISGNVRQLHQVFLNLFVNACDAMPHGGTLQVATVCHAKTTTDGIVAPHDNVLEVTVTDSGCGIPSEIQQAVFEPFFSTKPSTQGSGMGLAIVNEIVQAHGGCVTISSEVNQGTTFHLYFPQKHSERTELIYLPTVLGNPHPKVLVVDDDPLVAETTMEILRVFGCEPVMVNSCEEAIEVYRQQTHEIELIVLDLSMPTMGGEDCFNILRTINSSVRVVFASGYEKSFFIQQLFDEGLAGFVQKPFDVEDLSLALKHVCSNNREESSCVLAGVSSATSEKM